MKLSHVFLRFGLLWYLSFHSQGEILLDAVSYLLLVLGFCWLLIFQVCSYYQRLGRREKRVDVGGDGGSDIGNKRRFASGGSL